MELFSLFARQAGKLVQLTPQALPLHEARKRWRVKLSQGAVLGPVEGNHDSNDGWQGNKASQELRDTVIQTAFRGFQEKVKH